MKHLFLFSALLVLLTSCQKQPNLTVRYEQAGNLTGPFVKYKDIEFEVITNAKNFQIQFVGENGEVLTESAGKQNTYFYWKVPQNYTGKTVVVKVTAFNKNKSAHWQQLIKLY